MIASEPVRRKQFVGKRQVRQNSRRRRLCAIFVDPVLRSLVENLKASSSLLLGDRAQVNMKNDMLRSSEPAYMQIMDEDKDEPSPSILHRSSFFTPLRLFLSVLLVVLTVCGYSHWTSKTRTPAPHFYERVSTRREWRTLTMLQKHDYIAAVRCLKITPSRLALNHTLYDDFPYIHYHIGEYGTLHLMHQGLS
jgi:hypothetical protein